VNEDTYGCTWTCEDCYEPHERWIALRDEHGNVHWRLPCTATIAEVDYDHLRGDQPDAERAVKLSATGHGEWVWIEYGEQPDGAPAWILVEVDRYQRD
jgi:hypothetical protein